MSGITGIMQTGVSGQAKNRFIGIIPNKTLCPELDKSPSIERAKAEKAYWQAIINNAKSTQVKNNPGYQEKWVKKPR